MKLPVAPSERAVAFVLRGLRRTWRYRDARAPRQPADPHLPPAIYALWHEHLAALGGLHMGQGAAVLASRHRDGEIVARALGRLGYRAARGSTSRGGGAGLREMVRLGRSGVPLGFTPDGPRGPARRVKPGIIVAAAMTGLPVVPVALAATRYRRLDSWDRFLLPAPGATLFVSRGTPLTVPESARLDPEPWVARLERALEAERKRCERVAAAPRARPRLARRVEHRIRRGWSGRPPPATRAAGAAFGLGSEARHFLYDTGIARAHRASIPVISIGGLTVGGSAKTPVSSEVGRWLSDSGATAAIVSRGYPDELWLHRRLNPDALVLGQPSRYAAVEEAAASGATAALLDDGFQHRRLYRDLDLLLVDLGALSRTNRRRLPAGPFRDGPSAVGRADAIVFVERYEAGREPTNPSPFELALDWARRRYPSTIQAGVRLVPGDIEPANAAALAGASPRPRLGLTGIMKPNLFFRQVAGRLEGVEHFHALPDHGVPDDAEWAKLLALGGAGGIITTWKDVPRLHPRLDGVPLWVLSERLEWMRGRESLRARVLRVVEEYGIGSR